MEHAPIPQWSIHKLLGGSQLQVCYKKIALLLLFRKWCSVCHCICFLRSLVGVIRGRLFNCERYAFMPYDCRTNHAMALVVPTFAAGSKIPNWHSSSHPQRGSLRGRSPLINFRWGLVWGPKLQSPNWDLGPRARAPTLFIHNPCIYSF